MYIPKNWHLFRALGISMIGFYATQVAPKIWEVAVFFCSMQFIALADVTRWLIAGLLYQAYITKFNLAEFKNDIKLAFQSRGPIPKVEPKPGEFVPLVRTVKPAFSQVVAPIKVDKERSFAVALLRMYEFNPLKVDLTEGKWVKSGKFTRGEFVAMLEKWKDHGIIVRKSAKRGSPYIVVKWEAVRLVAEGNPLPPLN